MIIREIISPSIHQIVRLMIGLIFILIDLNHSNQIHYNTQTIDVSGTK